MADREFTKANKRTAEGAQNGLSSEGPTNVFPFQGTPNDPDLPEDYDLTMTTAEGYLDQIPGHGDTDIPYGKFPDIPIA